MNNFVPIINHSLKYSPSIDGLRGIAISLVFIFHLWPDYFSFGYVGVDIFFVLSGYLITQIIYTKLENGNFSLKEFYRNRVRRIFPALIIVLSSSLFIGYLVLYPSEFVNLSKHTKSSAFFYENFQLISEVGYWDESAILKPLLHFWSLAIEEQFYLFWPLILIVMYRIRLNILVSSVLLFLTLFFFANFLDIDKFYNTLSRAWELAFGGLIFIISYKYKNLVDFLYRYKLLIYFFFFISILYSYNNISFDIFKTLFVVLTTGILIINICNSKNNLIFSNRILIFIGIISFPLYLWHYVIISFLHIAGYNVSEIGIYIIIFSIIISYFTYRYIEIYSRSNNSYVFTVILIFILVIIGLFSNYILNNKGLENRLHFLNINNEFQKEFIRTPEQNELGISLITKVLGYKPKNDYIKATSDDLSKKYILVIGDSHAHTSYPGFEKYSKNYGYESILFSNSSCPPYLGGAMGKDIEDLISCKEKIENIYKLVNSELNIEKIIIATRMGYMYNSGYGIEGKWNLKFEQFYENEEIYDHKNIFLSAIERTFSYFDNKKIKVYYLLENPELGFSPKECLIRPFGKFNDNLTCRLTLESYLNRSGEYRNFISKLQKKYININILDPKDLYCDNNYCYAIRNNVLLYADSNHHSISGSILQTNFFINELNR